MVKNVGGAPGKVLFQANMQSNHNLTLPGGRIIERIDDVRSRSPATDGDMWYPAL